MENLDLTAVARMGLILAHLLAFAAAFAAVAFGDFMLQLGECLLHGGRSFGAQLIEHGRVYFDLGRARGAWTTGSRSWLSAGARPWPGMCFTTGSTPP